METGKLDCISLRSEPLRVLSAYFNADESHVVQTFHAVCALVRTGAIPIIVFDGNVNYAKGTSPRRPGRFRPQLQTSITELCIHLGLPFLRAPGCMEAETFLAGMDKIGMVRNLTSHAD